MRYGIKVAFAGMGAFFGFIIVVSIVGGIYSTSKTDATHQHSSMVEQSPQDQSWAWLDKIQINASSVNIPGASIYTKSEISSLFKDAEKGDASASLVLGDAYAKGNVGLPQDYTQAHMWYNIAAALGDSYAAQRRVDMASRMSTSQIERAQQLATDWEQKHRR